MKYQLADMNNGAFGEVFDTLEQAESALAEVVAEGQAINDEYAEDGAEPADASEFFCIVNAETGEEI